MANAIFTVIPAEREAREPGPISPPKQMEHSARRSLRSAGMTAERAELA